MSNGVMKNSAEHLPSVNAATSHLPNGDLRAILTFPNGEVFEAVICALAQDDPFTDYEEPWGYGDPLPTR